MEKILFNRRLGAIVLAVCVLLGLLYGSHRSLAALRGQAEDVFTNGANGDGLSISRDLDQRVQLANNLQTVAKRYLGEEDDLLSNLEDAAAQLSAAKGPKEKFQADAALEDAFQSLYRELEGRQLSEQDGKYRARLYDDFVSRGKTISHDSYNRVAGEFNDEVLGVFPASFLAKATGITPLELYQ